MGKNYRQGRLGEEIKKIISSMLLRELKDPRLSGMVSITAVEVTSDGGMAKVFFTVLATDTDEKDRAEKKEEVLAALRSSKGRIRKEIGEQIRLRHVPDIVFMIDSSMEYGRHMEELIDKVVKNDD